MTESLRNLIVFLDVLAEAGFAAGRAVGAWGAAVALACGLTIGIVAAFVHPEGVLPWIAGGLGSGMAAVAAWKVKQYFQSKKPPKNIPGAPPPAPPP